jgi:hypothetical protein
VLKLEKRCLFCEEGVYEIYAKPGTDPGICEKVRKLGLRTIVTNNWMILICNKCGNVQLFRQDLVE